MPLNYSRYQRQMALPDLGLTQQVKLKEASVLVIGCGGLGHPVATYLAGAGIGTIGLIDDDTVELSNLHRQIAFQEGDIGKKKAEILSSRLKLLNKEVSIKTYLERLNSINAEELIANYDVIVDCTDNFPTRYLTNDVCVSKKKPMVYGSIYQYEGQVSLFNHNGSANYRDLYPIPPSAEAVPDCETGGVIGSLAGIIGSIQANETIKLICGIDGLLVEKLLIFDAKTNETRIIKYKPNTRISEQKTSQEVAEICDKKNKDMVKEVSVSELKQMMDNKDDFQLIDVRENHEVEICTLDGELIPLGQLPENEDKIATDKKVIIHCRSGARSAQAVSYLQGKLGHDEMYNLKGGILAWANEIDPSMPKY